MSTARVLDHHRRRRADSVPRPDRLATQMPMRRRSDGASAGISASKGAGVRVVAIDGRCSRHLDPDDRRMVDALEWAMGAPSGPRAGAAVHPPRARLHVAVPAAARHPSPRGVGRGDLQRWCLGAAGQMVRRTAPPVPRPGALGVVRRVLPASSSSSSTSSSRSPTAPATVVLLSGDVHCSYTAGATAARHAASGHGDPPAHDVARSATTSNGPPNWPTGCSDDSARPARSAASPHRLASPRRTSRGSSTRVPGSPMASCRSSSTAPRHGRSSSTPTSRDGDRQELERTLELELSPTG